MALTFSGFPNALVAQSSCSSAQFLSADQEVAFEYSGAGIHWIATETLTNQWAFYFKNMEQMEVDSMRVFRGNCPNLQLLGTAYPSPETMEMSFYADSLPQGVVVRVAIYSSSAAPGHPFSARYQSFSTTGICQNLPNCELVCNGSLENSFSPWWAAAYTPDQFNGTPSVWTSILPRTGSGMGGMFTYFPGFMTDAREGIQVQLENPVNQGYWVYGEMYVNFDPNMTIFNSSIHEGYTDFLEMLFTNGSYQLSPTLPPNPPSAQITPIDANGNSTIGWMNTGNWQKISGVFEVQANQVDHLTISNFRDDAFTASHVGDPSSNMLYVLVDDIDVQELPGAGADKVVCNTSSPVQIGTGYCQGASGVTVSWSPTTGLNNPNIAQPTATVSQTTTYTMTATYNGITYTDQVTINLNQTPKPITVTDNCNTANRMATITFPNYDPDNQYSLNGVTNFTYVTANQNGSQFTFEGINYTNYKDVGEYTFDIVSGPDAGCSITGNIVKCCMGLPIALAKDKLLERNDVANWSGQSFEVGDYFTIDDDITIEGSTFWMHPDAQIRIASGADVTFQNCTFNVADCDPPYKWDGIIVESGAVALKLNNCEVFDAFRGVYNPGHLTKVILEDNDFSDNRMSVVITDQSWSGFAPLAGSYTQITGNRFDLEAPISMGLQTHPLSPLDITNFLPSFSFPQASLGPVFTNPSVHILADNVKKFVLGSGAADPNIFGRTYTSFTSVLEGGTLVLIANSDNVKVFNNEFEMQDPHLTFYRATAQIGGFSTSQSNTFDAFLTEDYRGIHAIESSLDIIGNDFIQGADIYSRNATTNSHGSGTLPWHGFGSRIVENVFKGGTKLNDQNKEEVFPCRVFAEVDPGTAPHTHPTFNIVENAFRGSSQIKMKNFGEPQDFAPWQPVHLPSRIYGNGFHGEGFAELQPVEDRAFISVLNSQDMVIAENNMDCSKPNQSGGPDRNYFCSNAIGIYLRNCTDMEVNGNGNSPVPPISTNEPVKIGGNGISINGEMTGTQLHCNELDSNQVHIDLDVVNAWTNQGTPGAGADNVFTNVISDDISGQLDDGSSNGFTIEYFTSGGVNLTPTVSLSVGTLTIKSASSNGCTALPKYKKSNNEERKQAAESLTFSIYPNPSNKRIFLETNQPGKKAYLRSLEGRLLMEKEIELSRQSIHLEGLPAGVYLLQYGNKTEKLLLQK